MLRAGIAVLAVVLVPSSALAAGSLSLSSSAAPTTSLTLSGVDQTTTFTIPTTIADTRASTAGWSMTITSTTFSTGTSSLADTASMVTSAPSAVCQSGCGGAIDPVTDVSSPVAVPAAASQPTPAKIFNAQPNTGEGTFTVTPTVEVAVPASTFAGAYRSTITVAV